MTLTPLPCCNFPSLMLNLIAGFRQGGRYIVDLLDNYAAGWPYLFIGFTELVAMYWMYGVRNYYRDLSSIMGFNPGFRLKAHITSIYGTVSPLLVGVSPPKATSTLCFALIITRYS